MSQRAAHHRLIIYVLLFAIPCYLLAMVSPVYTDEIAWKLIQGHYWADGETNRTMNLVPSCGSDTAPLPRILVPLRELDSLIFTRLTTPFLVRLYGVALFVAWMVATGTLLRRLLPSQVSTLEIIGGLVAATTLGVMPFFMVISRPEQIQLLGLSFFLLLAVGETDRAMQSFRRDAVVAGLVFLGGVIVVGSHPRGFFFLPIIAVCSFKIISRRWLAAAVATAISAIGLIFLADVSRRFACPGDPTVAATLSRESIMHAASQGELPAFLSGLWKLLLSSPGMFFYLTEFGFRTYYVSGILLPLPSALSGVDFVVTMALATLVGVIVLAGIYAYLLRIRDILHWRTRLTANLALAGVWALLVLSILSRLTRNSYEVELMLPTMLLASVVSIWSARDLLTLRFGAAQLGRALRGLYTGLLLCALASEAIVTAGYSPLAMMSWLKPGYPVGQPVSISTADFTTSRRDIRAAAQKCGITPDRNLNHLVVDELTYFAFPHLRQPYLMLYLNPFSWGRGIHDLRGLLHDRHSDGAIIGCQWVPKSLAAGVIRSGGFCCIPAF